MYHSLALEDVLDLINIARVYEGRFAARSAATISDWPEIARRMRNWRAQMCHPDGEIAFFNDAAIGIAPAPAAIEDYAQRLELCAGPKVCEGILNLEELGYVRLVPGPMVALLDVARASDQTICRAMPRRHPVVRAFHQPTARVCQFGDVLLRHQPREAPAARHGRPQYGRRQWRRLVRGVVRVSRRAPRATVWVGSGGTVPWWSRARMMAIAASPASPPQSHMECARRRAARTDSVSGPDRHSVANFHFHPDVKPEVLPRERGGRGVRPFPTVACLLGADREGEARLESASWHPRFGESLRTARLAVTLHQGRSTMEHSAGTREGRKRRSNSENRVRSFS